MGPQHLMGSQLRQRMDCADTERLETVAERRPARFRVAPGILVVDDDHLVRIMMQMGLELDGFNVRLASGGREAIKLYQMHRQEIAVVLLDVRMPELDGPQTLNALRELDPEVRACFMCGDTSGYEPDELLRRGAAHLIRKPFHVAELANVLRKLAVAEA